MLVTHIQALPPTRTQPAAVEQLEQAFLEEMLKYCGPKAAGGGFGGGAGEDQFNSFLTREYAARLASQLDLGLANRMDLS